jgi:hypothetical protein
MPPPAGVARAAHAATPDAKDTTPCARHACSHRHAATPMRPPPAHPRVGPAAVGAKHDRVGRLLADPPGRPVGPLLLQQLQVRAAAVVGVCDLGFELDHEAAGGGQGRGEACGHRIVAVGLRDLWGVCCCGGAVCEGREGRVWSLGMAIDRRIAGSRAGAGRPGASRSGCSGCSSSRGAPPRQPAPPGSR